MKIGIVTFHFVNNFGGALQAYALKKTIMNKCGAAVAVVDYRNWFIRFTDTVRLFPITFNISEFVSGLRTMAKRFSRVRKFKKFGLDEFELTRIYRNVLSLRISPPNCDKYIFGSDQIWNPVLTFGVATPYFGGFVKDSNDKFSYAPSFGSSRLPRIFKNKIRKCLLSFGNISVREQSGIKLVSSLTGRKAIQLIDPSFLPEQNEWNEIAVTPQIHGKYILLYIMQHDESIYKYAQKLREKLGIQLVEISRYGYKPDFVDISLVDIGPREFIGLFQNAACVCTNSYHGLSFSLIFEKKIYLIQCKRFTTRINNLLELLHIDMPDVSDTEELQSMVYDKELVRNIVREEREKAVRYIKINLGT